MEDISNLKAALLNAGSRFIPEEEQLPLLLKGILFTLKEEHSPEAVQLLGEGVLSCPLPEIQPLCLAVLIELASMNIQEAVDQLFFLAVENNIPAAAEAILHGNNLFRPTLARQQAAFNLLYNPAQLINTPHVLSLLADAYQKSTAIRSLIMQRAATVYLLDHWRQIVNALIENDQNSMTHFLTSYNEYSQEEKTLAVHLLHTAAQKNEPLAADTLCHLFILFEDLPALLICREQGYLPADAVQKAAFLFLSEAWDKYQKFDYNHSLISLAYENAAEPVRKRLLNLSRQSGINDWVANLSHQSQKRWLADMNDNDWLESVNSMYRNQLWPELWQLCQVAPPIWAQFILTQLAAGGWQPHENSEDYLRLIKLAADCERQPYELRKENVLHCAEASFTTLALSSNGDLLAAGTKDHAVLLWDVNNDFAPLNTLQGPLAMTRAIAFDSRGEYLAAANIDNALRIYKLPEGKLVKTLQGHENIVKTLCLHPDGRVLFSADFDGKMIAWRFPYGTELSRHKSGRGEIHRLDISPNGGLLFSAGARPSIEIWDWNTWKNIKKLDTGGETITHIHLHHNLPLIVFSSMNGRIQIWNYDTEKQIETYQGLSAKTLVTAFNLFSDQNLVVCGSNTGDIEIRQIFSGRLISHVRAAGSATTINGLALLEKKALLLGATSDGKIYIWNLAPLFTALKPVQNISSTEVENLQRLYQNGASPSEKKWLELILALAMRHKQYDIHIEDGRAISTGEFDILL